MELRCTVYASMLLAGVAFAQCDDVPTYDATPGEIAGATFGSAVAVSAAGDVALVGGTGFDGADGIVRTFEKVSGEWVEGPAFIHGQFIGEGFGWALAMSHDGNTAAVSAPHAFDFDASPFVPYAGVVDIWERDPGTGVWSRTHQFFDPEPASWQSFGASVDLTPDGSTVIIGRAAVMGSEFDPLPDSAFVATRTGSAWSELTALVPAVAPDPLEQFGLAVAISDDGTTAAVTSPGDTFLSGEDGEICIFSFASGSWQHTETITGAEPGLDFNVDALIFDGSTLIATNTVMELGPNFEKGPPLIVFDGTDGSYGPEPDAFLWVPESLLVLRDFDWTYPPSHLGAAFDLKGDRMIVGAPGERVDPNTSGGGVYRLDRVDGLWTFISRLQASEPADLGAFGASVAISADGSDHVVGEPGYTPSFDLFTVGRVHFANQVFREAPFEIVAAASTLTLELLFPDVPLQILEFIIGGSLDFLFPEPCDDTDPVTQVQIVGGTLTTDDKAVITVAPGVTVTISSITLSVENPLAPATLNPTFDSVIEDAVLTLAGDIEFFGIPLYHAEEPVTFAQFPIRVTGTTADGLSLEVPEFTFDPQIDVGPDVIQPTISGTMTLMGEGATPPCNPADLAAPFGLLDLADVTAFAVAFQGQDGAADLAEPIGIFDLADVVEFVIAFNAGCP